jgi:hypothetical protein
MKDSKNLKVKSKIIDDHLYIQDTKIDIRFYVNNWGEPFDRELLKKKIEQAIEESKVSVQDIKNIEIKTLLIKYTDKESISSDYTMEDNKLIVYLSNDARPYILNIDQFILIP